MGWAFGPNRPCQREGGRWAGSALAGLSALDHVIVRAVDGRTLWLDGTRSGDGPDERAGRAAVALGLGGAREGGALEPLVVTPAMAPVMRHEISVDASGPRDAPAPVQGRMVFAGDVGRQMLASLNAVPEARLDEALRAVWRRHDPWINAQSVDHAMQDGALVLTMRGVADVPWQAQPGGAVWALDTASRAARGGGHARGCAFIALSRLGGAADRGPLARWCRARRRGDVDEVAGARALFRHVERDGAVLRVTAHVRPLANEISPAQAMAGAAAGQAAGTVRVVVGMARSGWPMIRTCL
jgi:hypothetical protein